MQILTSSTPEFAGDPWETETLVTSVRAVWKGSRHAGDAMQDAVLQVGASSRRTGVKSSVEWAWNGRGMESERGWVSLRLARERYAQLTASLDNLLSGEGTIRIYAFGTTAPPGSSNTSSM